MRHALFVLSLTACAGPASDGLRPADPSGGPKVVYDLLAEPLPEVPLPNDAATRLDPGSATGRRLNISLASAVTDHEREVRTAFNQMDGFGTYAPITVSFDAPLDIDALRARHATNDDFRDDAVFLLNVDPDCARFGEEIAVDLGGRRNPVTMYGHARPIPDERAPDGYRVPFGGNTLFPYDAHAFTNNKVFEELYEDVNDNGVLDPGEDLDGDGRLDLPNLDDPTACRDLPVGGLAYDQCVADRLLTFYERESNTLILLPLWPMEERCTHAVVLTDRLIGEDGLPIDSPFRAINPRDQTDALAPVPDLISRYGLSATNLRFAWSFTTGSMTADLRSVRAGLYGAGPFARLAQEFPPVWSLWTRGELSATFDGVTTPAGREDDTFLPGACMSAAMTRFWNDGLGEWDANMCAVGADLGSVAAWFGGTFDSPNLLVDKDGVATPRYPSDQDERWEIDPAAGTITYGTTTSTFFCVLPQEDPTATCEPGNPQGVPFCKPYPVTVFAHGYGSSRAEFSLHMGRHTAMGSAACAVDSYGHGLSRWLVDPEASGAIRLGIPDFARLGVPELAPLLALGRDRDLNNDGLPDGGADQWTADIFHTRDMVRQSVVDVMQLVRILRHMDGDTRDADGRLLGDVDGDGTVDLGGPAVPLGHWGISLGGIISGVLAGAEPGFDALAPNAGGAGLTDVSKRSTQSGVPEAVQMPMLGQLVVGCLPTDGHDNPIPVGEGGGTDCWEGRGAETASWQGGTLRLAMYAQDNASLVIAEFGAVEGVQPGDRIILRNLRNGQTDEQIVNRRGWFRARVAADALDAIERRPVLGLTDADLGPFEVPDPTLVADALEIEVIDGATGAVRAVVDTFQREVIYQGSRFRKDVPLVALMKGYGYHRNENRFRRLLGIAQHALSPGDPATWGQHAFLLPHDVSDYDPFARPAPSRLLVMPTAGDGTVPANTGVAQGRTAGALGSFLRDETLPPEHGWRELFTPLPRLGGVSAERHLVNTWVVEGDARLRRFPDNPLVNEVIYDVDDVSDGTAQFSCGPSDWSALIGENNCPPELQGQEVFFDVPSPPPGGALRYDRPRPDGFVDGFRIPLLRPGGQHGIYNAQSFRRFDADATMVNHTARYLLTGGRTLTHEPGCDCSASDTPLYTLRGELYEPLDRTCTEDDLKVCSPACASAWGIRTAEESACGG